MVKIGVAMIAIVLCNPRIPKGSFSYTPNDDDDYEGCDDCDDRKF